MVKHPLDEVLKLYYEDTKLVNKFGPEDDFLRLYQGDKELIKVTTSTCSDWTMSKDEALLERKSGLLGAIFNEGMKALGYIEE